MFDLSFLPSNLVNKLNELDLDKLYEIRLRKNREILVFYDNKYLKLSEIINEKEDIICFKSDIDYVIDCLTEHSLYAYNEQIKSGFITSNKGIRVGICGDVIFDNGKVKTINNFSSLNIRIPHNINNSSSEIFNKMFDGQTIKNSLIISAPFMGKTTILKDLAIKLDKFVKKQILLIDERGEFESIEGNYIDKINFSNKEYALSNGIRSIAPEIIITDEIKEDDFISLQNAKNSGVKIIASCHANSIEELTNKPLFRKNIFDMFFVLESNNIKGKIQSVYDCDLNRII